MSSQRILILLDMWAKRWPVGIQHPAWTMVKSEDAADAWKCEIPPALWVQRKDRDCGESFQKPDAGIVCVVVGVEDYEMGGAWTNAAWHVWSVIQKMAMWQHVLCRIWRSHFLHSLLLTSWINVQSLENAVGMGSTLPIASRWCTQHSSAAELVSVPTWIGWFLLWTEVRCHAFLQRLGWYAST